MESTQPLFIQRNDVPPSDSHIPNFSFTTVLGTERSTQIVRNGSGKSAKELVFSVRKTIPLFYLCLNKRLFGDALNVLTAYQAIHKQQHPLFPALQLLAICEKMFYSFDNMSDIKGLLKLYKKASKEISKISGILIEYEKKSNAFVDIFHSQSVPVSNFTDTKGSQDNKMSPERSLRTLLLQTTYFINMRCDLIQAISLFNTNKGLERDNLISKILKSIKQQATTVKHILLDNLAYILQKEVILLIKIFECDISLDKVNYNESVILMHTVELEIKTWKQRVNDSNCCIDTYSGFYYWLLKYKARVFAKARLFYFDKINKDSLINSSPDSSLRAIQEFMDNYDDGFTVLMRKPKKGSNKTGLQAWKHTFMYGHNQSNSWKANLISSYYMNEPSDSNQISFYFDEKLNKSYYMKVLQENGIFISFVLQGNLDSCNSIHTFIDKLYNNTIDPDNEDVLN